MAYLNGELDYCANFYNSQYIDSLIDINIPESYIAEDLESALSKIKLENIDFIFFPVEEKINIGEASVNFNSLTFYKSPFEICLNKEISFGDLKICDSEQNSIYDTQVIDGASINKALKELTHNNFNQEAIEYFFKNAIKSFPVSTVIASKNNKILWHVDSMNDDELIMLLNLNDGGTIFCDLDKHINVDKSIFTTSNFKNKNGESHYKILKECQFYTTPKDYAVIFKHTAIHTIPATKNRILLRF